MMAGADIQALDIIWGGTLTGPIADSTGRSKRATGVGLYGTNADSPRRTLLAFQ